MSTKKPPAKQAATARPKVAAKPAAPPARTKTSKSAATARATPVKASAKLVSKPAAKPAAKAPAKPAPKAAAKPATAAKATPVVKPVPAAKASPAPKPLTAPAPAAAAPAPSPAPSPAPIPQTTKMTPAAKSKASAKAQAAYAAPAPMPAPTSRFADRFAPPRPPTRQMGHLEVDSPKQAQKFDPRLANAWKTKAGPDLTEAELLAMPEAEYMNDKQLEYFRATLQRLKDDLLSNAGETTEHLREDTSIVPDPADRATIEEEHALELRTRDRERKLLKKISQSLARIEAGDYGFCDETGEPIGLGRLLARPTATLSLEAQQRRELKQRMFGD